MVKLVSLTLLVVVAFISNASCQRYTWPKESYGDGPKIILPTYRPPVARKPITRYVREAVDEPQWLYKGDIPRAPATGDHPILPPYIDDIKLNPNRRYIRSLDSPSAKRYGRSITDEDMGTEDIHPGNNHRNARSIRPSSRPDFGTGPYRPYNPFKPRPGHPRRPLPIYARNTRDIHIPGMRKPSHRDVIIPNWNPHARTNPWNSIGGRGRRSVDVLENKDDIYLGQHDEATHEE